VVDLAPRIDIIETYNPWCDVAANQAAARLAEELDKVAATGSDSHSALELGRSWMEMEEYSGTPDFLDKLRYARHVVTASSGTARQEHGRNVDLGSADEIYEHWKPDTPRGYSGWAFVGSMRPDRQAIAMRALHHSARLLAADAMFSYIKHHTIHAKDVLRRAA